MTDSPQEPIIPPSDQNDDVLPDLSNLLSSTPGDISAIPTENQSQPAASFPTLDQKSPFINPSPQITPPPIVLGETSDLSALLKPIPYPAPSPDDSAKFNSLSTDTSQHTSEDSDHSAEHAASLSEELHLPPLLVPKEETGKAAEHIPIALPESKHDVPPLQETPFSSAAPFSVNSASKDDFSSLLKPAVPEPPPEPVAPPEPLPPRSSAPVPPAPLSPPIARKKKFPIPRVVLGAFLFLLVALPITYFYVNNRQQQIAELRQFAIDCPSGQIFCGGCIGACRPATQTCNTWIDQECSQPNCGGDGAFPPAGQSCCAGLSQCSNGRCAPSCIGPTTPPVQATQPPANPTAVPTSGSGTSCPGQGGLNQTCRTPQNCNNEPNCDSGLVCQNGTCVQASGGACGSSGQCRICTCSQCHDYGNGLPECRDNCQNVPCGQANLGGSCGQVDFLDSSGNYCGVAQQACTGACAGGGTTPTSPPRSTNTPTNTPIIGQCDAIQIFKGNVPVSDFSTIVPGDQIFIAVNGTNASQARVRVNGGQFQTTGTKNNNGDYIVPFTIPGTGVRDFTVEAEVQVGGVWK